MANRRQTGNPIRGPRSALTDFLASNNISAAQIHRNHERRLRDAERQYQSTGTEAGGGHGDNTGVEVRTQEPGRKRRRNETATLTKIKQSKELAQRKSRRIGGGQNMDDYTSIAERTMMHERPGSFVPGQLGNCEICGKRFTVTAYNKTGPDGGLICPKCYKDLADKEKPEKAKRRGPRSGRRQNQSNLLDGIAQQGASSLVDMCTKMVADNIQDIEEFGDLPRQLLHHLSRILSKRRVLTPRTLNLFLRPDLDSIDIYDCAKLETEDFQKIFTFMPSLVNVNLRFAGQMKNSVVEYLIDRKIQIKHLCLDATNLVSDTHWRQLFQKSGSGLESLKLSNLDSSLDDQTVEELCKNCTGLRRLKLKQCWKMGDKSLRAISGLTALEHLSLSLMRETEVETLLEMVRSLGPKLQTLSLEGFSNADDRLLETIHEQCHSVTKLRLSENAVFTNKGFVRLFKDWRNPPLKTVDVSSTRDVDYLNPDGPSEPTGLASEGFVAMMEHSGATIEKINMASCRHVSHGAFEEVFSEDKKYPQLKEMDVSFHTEMDDYLVNCIIRSCPALQKLIAFACFNVREVRVPVGVALIGGLKAQDLIIAEGEGGYQT